MIDENVMCVVGRLVPSVPRGLRLSIVQDEPPVIAALWQAPRQTHGRLITYRLHYGIVDNDDDDEFPAEVRQLDAEKYRFTTGFLGQCCYIVSCTDLLLDQFPQGVAD